MLKPKCTIDTRTNQGLSLTVHKFNYLSLSYHGRCTVHIRACLRLDKAE